MADHEITSAGHPDMDYAAHEQTYAQFIKLTKYGIVFLVLLLIFLAFMWG